MESVFLLAKQDYRVGLSLLIIPLKIISYQKLRKERFQIREGIHEK